MASNYPTSMKAWLLKKDVDPAIKRNRIALETIPVPKLEPDEVLVKLSAAALNHRDEWQRMGMYPGIVFDVVQGADGSGVIEALGSKVDTESKAFLHKGSRVIVDGTFNFGTDRMHILGMPVNGTFAQYVILPAANVYPCPQHLSSEEAAALPLAGLTAYRAVVTKGEVGPGSKVLVTGVGGGVAIQAVQLVIALGAEVWVTSSSEEKIRRAVAMGAKGGTNYRKAAASAKNTRGGASGALAVAIGRESGWGGEFDCVIDGSAGEGLNAYVRLVRVGGKIVSYGVTAGVPKNFGVAPMFLKNVDLCGTAMGSPEEMAALVSLVKRAKIVPVIDSVEPFEKLDKQFAKMRAADQFGKLVVRINPSIGWTGTKNKI
eukprot:Clim_evm35s99 gene=Clim_evmTU35s99